MLGFHLSTRSCRRSLGWIGPYIGSNRISRRGSKIQSKKTHQHHHHPKMEDGSVTQRKPVMVDPRNIPTYDLSAQAMQKIETFFSLIFFVVWFDWMFYFKFGVSCRVTYGLYAGVHYSWSWISTVGRFESLWSWKLGYARGVFKISCILLGFHFTWLIWARGQVVSCFSTSKSRLLRLSRVSYCVKNRRRNLPVFFIQVFAACTKYLRTLFESWQILCRCLQIFLSGCGKFEFPFLFFLQKCQECL